MYVNLLVLIQFTLILHEYYFMNIDWKQLAFVRRLSVNVKYSFTHPCEVLQEVLWE